MVDNRDEAIEKILNALREGHPEYNAARAGGIEYSRWWDWKQEMPGLQARVDAARKSRVILYEDALHKAALKGSVNACIILLRKESREWRELLDGSIAPNPSSEMIALGHAAAAGAAAIINMLSQEKKLRIKAAMAREGLLVLPDPSVNGNVSNGTNGNGSGH